MSLPDAGRIGTKILIAAIFVALAVFNFQVVLPVNSTRSGLDLAGVRLEAFMPSATAEIRDCGLVYCITPWGSWTGCARTFTSSCGQYNNDCGC